MITHEQVVRDLDSASKIICLLTNVARAAFYVADDTEERCFGSKVEYVVPESSYGKEGFTFIGIDSVKENVELANQRIYHVDVEHD